MSVLLIRYLGGKINVAKKIIPYIPEGKTYIEPFGGGAFILLNKQPSRVEIYNDIDREIFNLFSVISSKPLFMDFYDKVKYLPYHKALFEESMKNLKKIKINEISVDRAVWTYIRYNQSFGGLGKHWGLSVTISRKRIGKLSADWIAYIRRLPYIYNRLRKVQFECSDYSVVIKKYDREDSVFYCDPPYPEDDIASYTYPFGKDDYKKLISLLVKIKGSCVLSSYKNEANALLEEHGWIRKDIPHFVGLNRNKERQKKKTMESIWIKNNNKKQQSLRYLGINKK